jgi:D-psicose/D-tagatose/L-ribulose 3-epimerase
MNKIGIYFAYWTKEWYADFPYYIKKVAGLGFDILEISTANILELSKSELDKIKSTAEAENVELTYCIGLDKKYELASEDASIRKNGIKYLNGTLDAIHYMGGHSFCGLNYTAWPTLLTEGITDKSAYLERSAAGVREVIKKAEDYDILFNMEVVNRYENFLVNTASEAIAFVDMIGSPYAKILLDTYHMNIEEDNIGEAIISAGDKLGHFHIGECNRKVPGKGHMPWDEIAAALKQINYTGRIVMEPFVQMGGRVAGDIKVWRNLVENTDEATLDRDAKGALEFIREKTR